MKPVLTRAEVELCIRLDRAARYRRQAAELQGKAGKPGPCSDPGHWRVCEYGTNTVDRPICHYPYKCPYSTEDN